MNNEFKTHWDKVYSKIENAKLGWYEENPEACLRLTDTCNLNKADLIVEAGCGTGFFISRLIDNGFSNITAVDISEVALQKLELNLGEEKAKFVRFFADDLGEPREINLLQDIALWHDRAVLHFLISEEHIRNYFSTLNKIIKPGGYAILAPFALHGAKKCSGLPLTNYSVEMLVERMGSNFELIQSFEHVYINPVIGERPYIYTLFKRLS